MQAHAGGFIAMSSSFGVDPVSSRLHRTSRYLVTAGNDNLVKLWGMGFTPGQGGWTLSLDLVQNVRTLHNGSNNGSLSNDNDDDDDDDGDDNDDDGNYCKIMLITIITITMIIIIVMIIMIIIVIRKY